MFDFILIYLVSLMVLGEISIIHHQEPWSKRALIIACIPIINTLYLVGLLFITLYYNTFKNN